MQILQRLTLLATVHALLILVSNNCVYGQNGDDVLKDLELVVAGMKADRQQLQSGVFRVYGTETIDAPTAKESFHGNIEMFGAFDFKHGRFRFDRHAPSPNFKYPNSGWPAPQKLIHVL